MSVAFRSRNNIMTAACMACAVIALSIISPPGVDATYDYNGPLNDYLDNSGIFREGDITIGAISTVQWGANVEDGTLGKATHSRMVLRALALLYALDRINNDSHLLPGTTLGIHLRDDSGLPSVAVARAFQLISVPALGPMVNLPLVDRTYQPVALVGPFSTITTQAVTSIATLYNMLQVTATDGGSSMLASLQYFPYIYMTAAHPRSRFEAVLSVLNYFNFKLFSIVYQAVPFSMDAVQYLHVLTKDTDVCIEETYLVYQTERGGGAAPSHNVADVVKRISQAKARVLFLALYSYLEDALLYEIKRLPDTVQKRFIFVFLLSVQFGELRRGLDVIDGALLIRPSAAVDPGLRDHFRHINPLLSPELPWLPELWRSLYGCVPTEGGNSSDCGVDTTLADLIEDDHWHLLNSVVMAFYSVATAIDLVIRQRCPEAAGDRSHLAACIEPRHLTEVMNDIVVDAPTRTQAFDGHYINETFEILQVQFPGGDPSRALKVTLGLYDPATGQLDLDEDLINFNMDSEDIRLQENSSWPESVCSQPCGRREFQLVGELPCCWECYLCRDDEVVSADGSSCVTCPRLTWPDSREGVVCVALEPTYLGWTDVYGTVLSALAAGGVLCTGAVLVTVVTCRDRRVIKGSTWYMLVLMLAGIKLAYVSVFLHIARPSRILCISARLGFHLSFSLILGPLVVKVNRIFQVFLAASKLSRKVRMGSGSLQLALVLTIILVQLGLSVSTLVVWPADAVMTMPVKTDPLVELHCSVPVYSLLLCSSFNMLLLLACAVLAFLSRSLPDNFNESWYIFLCVSTTVFIWVAFFTTYFSAFYAYHQAALLAAALVLNAAVVLVALFAPKIYALLNVPEKNIKITDFSHSDVTAETSVADPPIQTSSGKATSL